MPETRVPVEQREGALYGRTSIFLKNIDFFDGLNTFVFNGHIDLGMSSTCQAIDDIPISLVFNGVLAFRLLELDSWREEYVSSFMEVNNSQWIAELGGKVTDQHRHFVVMEYDNVFDIVCSEF
ncbi:hypothetical protein [Microbulbifer aggregans]|uniref:hypothetical protein n=1 Tax=Microbulbifer aggregans TaxID=1769779 RepID=UPI001CFE8E94|nr:hypothetical protein [Microbulbifer aggregans]